MQTKCLGFRVWVPLMVQAVSLALGVVANAPVSYANIAQKFIQLGSRTLTLVPSGAHTDLLITGVDGRKLALERDDRIEDNAPITKLEFLGQTGNAVIVIDGYRSKTAGLSYCAAGTEQFLRVISIESRSARPTLSLKLSSCRDNIELASPVEWDQKAGVLRIDWLAAPPNGQEPEVRLYHVLDNGEIQSRSPLEPILVAEGAEPTDASQTGVLKGLEKTADSVCEERANTYASVGSIKANIQNNLNEAAVRLTSLGINTGNNLKSAEYQDDLATNILHDTYTNCESQVLSTLVSKVLPENAKKLLPNRSITRILYACAGDPLNNCPTDARYVCVTPAQGGDEFDVLTARLKVSGSDSHAATFVRFPGDDPRSPGRSSNRICIRFHTIPGVHDLGNRVDVKLTVQEKIISGNPDPPMEFSESMPQARHL
jgi:hypothetical protein